MRISTVDVTTLSTDDLKKEFKSLAEALSPINARRSAIAKEMRARADKDQVRHRISHFFPSDEERKAALDELRVMTGDSR